MSKEFWLPPVQNVAGTLKIIKNNLDHPCTGEDSNPCSVAGKKKLAETAKNKLAKTAKTS